MATVTATLKMFDAMTRPLQKITQGMNLAISAMEQMQRSADRNINIDRTLAVAKQQLAAAEASIRAEIERSTMMQDRFNRSVQNGESGISRMLNGAKALVATYLGLEAAKSVFTNTVGAAMEQQGLIDTLAARLGSADAAIDVFNRIKKQAIDTNQNVTQALSGVNAFLSNTTNPIQLEQLYRMAVRLSKLNPAEGFEGAAFAMKELMSGDYQSIVERFNIGRAAVQNSEALKAGKSGNIEAFIAGMDKLLTQQQLSEETFRRMLDAPAERWQRTVNRFKQNMVETGRAALDVFLPAMDAINKAFDSGKAQGFFTGLSAGLQVFANTVAQASVFAMNHLDELKAGLLFLGAVAVGVGAQWLVTWGIANWPILAIGAAIAGLMYLLNRFGISTQDIVGSVVGVFYTLGAAINNIIAYVWNYLVSFAEFLGNVFTNPVYAIQKLFYDMAENVTGFFGDMINKIIDGINWAINKMNQLVGTSVATLNHIDKATIAALKPEKPAGAVDFSGYKIAFKNIDGQFSKGYAAAAAFINKINSTFDAAKVYSMPPGLKAESAQRIANIGSVGEVGRIRDTVDISSEDLKTMRELAEMKSIQNFVTLQPQLTFGDMHIKREGRPVREIIAEINRELQEEITSSARMLLNV